MKRQHNEDSLFLPDIERLAVVADGMGGHASGEVASKMAVDTLAEHFRNTRDEAELTRIFVEFTARSTNFSQLEYTSKNGVLCDAALDPRVALMTQPSV